MLVVAVSAVVLSGCATAMPADPRGTLDRVQGGVLRVGATEHAPWVQLDGDEPVGTEPALVEEFAQRLDAEVSWTTGSEAMLVDALERGELDVVIGGFLESTPWSERGAATRPFAETRASDGSTQRHVMLVRLGENRFQLELERYLHEETGL